MRLDPRTPGSWPGPKADAQALSPQAPPCCLLISFLDHGPRPLKTARDTDKPQWEKPKCSKITWARCYLDTVSSPWVERCPSSSHVIFTRPLLSFGSQSHPLSLILGRGPHCLCEQYNGDPRKQAPWLSPSRAVSINPHWVSEILLLALPSEGEEVIPLLVAEVHSRYSLLAPLWTSLGFVPALSASLPHTLLYCWFISLYLTPSSLHHRNHLPNHQTSWK